MKPKFNALLCSLFLFSLTSLHAFAASEPAFYSGELWVQIDPGTAQGISALKKEADTEALKDLIGRELAEEFGLYAARKPFYFAQTAEISEVFQFYFTAEGREDEFARMLTELDFVNYAERVPIMRPTYEPDDLGPAAGNGNQYGLWIISAPQAWDITTGSTEVKVAIVDDAVLVTHPDLAPNLVPGYDVSADDPDPMPNQPGMTHGTHVAGIVGAATDNGIGVASIGFNIKIMPVKSSNSPTVVTDAYAGVIWAADNGADVINMSWGGSGFSQTGQNIIDYAYNAGCVNVAAAGNDNVTSIFYPAGYENCISVASTSANDGKSGFSNYGEWIDISAPGSAILSTYHNNYEPNYSAISGTSMASPMVAGLAGLVLSLNPDMPQQQVKDCILNSADDISASNPAYPGQLGSGRINAHAAVLCAQALVNAPPIAAVNASETVACPGSEVQFFGSSTGGLATSYQWNFTGGIPETSDQQNPSVIFPETGFYDITLEVSNEFGENTSTFSSFLEVSSNGFDIFFEEDFESGSLSAMGWETTGASGGTDWEITQVGGTVSGENAAGINLFNNTQTGARNGLISPPLTFTAHTNVQLDFRHAHRRRNAAIRDSLIVYISADGGATYDRLLAAAEDGQGSFATGTLLNQNFVPANGNDWCFGGEVGSGCFTVDLSEYAGEEDVRIKFETYNAGGNNIYIDDVQLSGNCLTPDAAPIASFTADDLGVCTGQTIQFSDQSINVPTGYSWTFEGGIPETSDLPFAEVIYETPGVYSVSLTVTNDFGTDELVFENYITVSDPPEIEVAAEQNAFCAGTSVMLTASGADFLSWTPGAGLNAVTGDTVTATPLSSVTYTVTGAINGCEGSAELALEVFPAPPEPDVISGDEPTFTLLEPEEFSGWFNFAEAGTGWSIPPLATLNAEAAIIIARDNSPGDSLLCGPASALTDLEGKIAVIYRGGCEFGTKALNAQNAGAAGVVVVNNTPDPIIEMNGGSNGQNVTIPTVMISDTDGVWLNAALQSGDASGVLGRFNGGSAICPDGTARLAGPAGFSDYNWSDGTVTGVAEIEAPGTYTLAFDNGICDAESEAFEFEISDGPIPVIEWNGSALFVANMTGTDWQWFLDGEPIDGANIAGLVTDLSGVFTVEVTNNDGCRVASEPFELTLSATDEGFPQGEMEIYPVPARDMVTVAVPDYLGEAVLTVFSAEGRAVRTLRISGGSAERIEINTGRWATGTYIVRFVTTDFLKTGRIVKVN